MFHVMINDDDGSVDNRFDLILLAAYRARILSNGIRPMVHRGDDKDPVVALRELSSGSISPDDVREGLIHSMQRFVEVDEPDSEGRTVFGSAGRENVYTDDDVHSSVPDSSGEEALLRQLMGITSPEGKKGGSSL